MTHQPPSACQESRAVPGPSSRLRRILPLLPATLVLLLWPLSHFLSITYARIDNPTERHYVQLTLAHGGISFLRFRHAHPLVTIPRGCRVERVEPVDDRAAYKPLGLYFLGFQFARHDYPYPYSPSSSRFISIPYWFLFLLSSPPPILFLRRHLLARRRTYRLAHNLCPICAYDVRSSPTRCPECGNAIDPAPPSPSTPEPTPGPSV